MFAFLDGAVSVERNLEILAHLNLCTPCARRFDAERRFESSLADLLRGEPVPADLPSRLAAALDRVDAENGEPAESGAGGGPAGPRPFLRRFAPLLAAAAVLAVAGVAGAWATCLGPFQCGAIRGAVTAAENVERCRTALCIQSGDPVEVERSLRERGAKDVVVPDLAITGYRLEGGSVAVPSDTPGLRGDVLEYRSATDRLALVRLHLGDHEPRTWNRVLRDGVEWYEAEWHEHRLVGWRPPEGGFRAVVGTASTASLRDVAASVRRR